MFVACDVLMMTRDQLDRFVRCLAPFAPHICEEIWSLLGRDDCVSLAPWPEFDEALLKDDEVEIPVQILGKVKGRITIAADASNDAIEQAARADERIANLLEGKTVRKVIVVPGRLINFVAN